MTVRTWFRILRATEWDAQRPLIQIYFRNETARGPLTPPFSLFTFADYQKLIEDGAPTHAIDELHREMLYGWRTGAKRFQGMAE